MLAGRRLFDGETVSHTLADVLRAPIDFDALPPATPRAIRELVKRCLDRDVRARLRDIGEARVVLQNCLLNPSPDSIAAASPLAARSTSRIGWVAKP
jgi:serine/threonine-protein kinase